MSISVYPSSFHASLSSNPMRGELAPADIIKLRHFEARSDAQRHRNIYAGVLKASAILLTLPILATPWTVQKASAWLAKDIWATKPRLHSIVQKLASQDAISNLYWRATSILGLSMFSKFQVSMNTKQPSKLLSEVLATAIAIPMLIRPSQFLKAMNFFCPVFWFLGERNDFANGNHLSNRREWDLKRLKQPQSWANCFRFIVQDLKYACSFKPWRGVFKKTGQAPNPDHSAVAVQFFMMTALSGVLMKDGKLKKALTSFGAITSALLTQIPLVQRAWQNKSEADGLLVLLGAPFLVAGKRFDLSDKSYLSSLAFIGATLGVEGKRRNSVKYRNTLEYLALLRTISLQNNRVTAQDFLDYWAMYPNEKKRLAHLFGKNRLQYVINHLQQAARSDQPLWQYLTPIVAVQSSS